MIYKELCAAVALLSGAASAAPSVFVPHSGNAWWNTPNAQGRVIGTAAAGVSATELSKYIEREETFYPFKVCALTNVMNDTYVGTDKQTQDEIVQTLQGVRWHVEGVTPNGRRVVAYSVLYEACDDPENRGAAVLVTDAQTSEIMLFETMGPGTRNGVSIPIWTAFLEKPEAPNPDSPIFTFSTCMECGAATAVYYDVTRKRLYMEYNGH